MIVNACPAGRLGNRLILSTALLAFCMEHDQEFIDPSLREYAHYFRGPSRDLLSRYPERARFGEYGRLRPLLSKMTRELSRVVRHLRICNRAVRLMPQIEDEYDMACEAFIQKVVNTRLVLIWGWGYRCPTYVARHASAIRRFLAPCPELGDRIREMIGPRTDPAMLIGLHMRQSDYKQFKGGRFYYELETYLRIMREIEEAVAPRPVRWLVCSCQKQSPESFGGHVVTITNGSPGFDLFSLAHCDEIIGPPSTFSRWASFWGDVPLRLVMSSDKEIAETRTRVARL